MTRTLAPARVHRIVAATEDASAAVELFSVARRMASRLGAELIPVRVRGISPSTVAAGAAFPPEPMVGVPVVEGIPAIEIVRFAESRKAGLVILGGRGAEGKVGNGLKVLADAVVRRAEMPCLVLPAGQSSFGRMVVALDGSERGMRALREAWGMRELSGAAVMAVFVEPDSARAEGVVGPGGTAGQRVEAGVAAVTGPGARVTVAHRQGDVVERVLQELRPDGSDLLVVGVRRGGPAAVAESTGNGRRLLAAASCAVLTVPL